MRKLFTALTLTTLSACVSQPVNLETAPHVPEERVLNGRYLQAEPGDVPFTVSIDNLRDVLFTLLVLRVDGVPVAEMDSGEVFKGHTQPGVHTVEIVAKSSEDFRFTQRDVFTEDSNNYRFSFDGSTHKLMHDTR